MTEFRDFKGDAKRLEDIDIPRIAAEIECGEDELHAFMDVEAGGSGFDNQGRPKILFEPHVFFKHLSGSKLDAAVKAGLAYKKWGTKPYPKDSYPRLIAAIKIDETAALKSTSWGLTQILGENAKDAGYVTPQAMVSAFMEDEENHLEATVELLKHMGIADDLKAHRWAVVARVWNGPGYAKNKYDIKIADAFAKWSNIKDTPYDASASAPFASVSPPRLYTDKIHVRIVQEELYEKGYTEVGSKKPDGSFDGSLGTMTKGAILLSKSENGFTPVNDSIDDAFLDALPDFPDRVLKRSDATDAQVREIIPEAKSAYNTKVLGLLGMGGAGAAGVGKAVIDFITPWKSLFSDIPSYVWMVLIAAGFGAVVWYAHKSEKTSVQAYQDGARR